MFMSPIVAYAKIAMSFWNLYRQRRPQANYTAAIAFAMSGIFVINVWSIILCVSLLDHGWLASRREISRIEFAMLLVGVLIAEFLFVDFIKKKATRDKTFFAEVGAASPSISIRYALISVALLVASTVLVAVSHWR
jgi:hypothetical protein